MMMMTILMMMMVVVLLWRFSHKRSQFGQTDILRKQNCNNCGRRSCWLSTLDLNKKKSKTTTTTTTTTKNKKEKFKDYCEAENNVYCILFSKQLFGWPYQPPQVYRCYCSGLHFPFHPPFDLSYRTPQPFIMLGYPAWASTLDTTVQRRWFLSPDQACLLQWNPVNPVTDE